MAELKHPAVEAAERVQNGEETNLRSLDRDELKYAIALVGGDSLDWDTDEIADDVAAGDGTGGVTKDELVALVEYMATVAGGE
jgi:hypothetical protein